MAHAFWLPLNFNSQNYSLIYAIFSTIFHCLMNRISGVMVSVFALSVVNRGQTKDYEIGICCFSAKHTALRRKSKD
jgi:hypothetical protein